MSEKEAEVLELKVEPKKEVEKIEKEILNGDAVTEEKVESSLNYDLLSEEEKAAIDEFCAKVDVSDTTQILQYGAAAQNKISTFSDSVLQNVKTKNTGDVGDLLSELVVQVKDFDGDVPESLNPKGLYGLFFSAKKSIEKMIAKFNKVETNIGKI